MAGAWQPIHENHAIDVMAAVVTFAQPLPDRLLKKVLQASEDVAFDAGLRSRHSVQQVTFAITGAAAPVQQGTVRGQIFNAQLDSPDGPPVAGRLAEQLQVDHTCVIYRTWRYVSWRWQRDQMRRLMMPALLAAQDVVAFANQRIEYLDRFKFDGEPSSVEFSSLLRKESGLITEHGVGRSELWHSYTGFFEPSPHTSAKRLFQINIDVLDEPSALSTDAPQVRWVNILTAREDRLKPDEIDGLPRDADRIFGSFDLMHAELKELFGKIVTDAVAERIYLMGQ